MIKAIITAWLKNIVTMSRNTRLWQDPGAVSISYDGDVSLGGQWLGYARGKLIGMLQSTTGPLSATYFPVPDVTIRIDTRPNRIRISAAGGVLSVTLEDITSGPGKYPVVGTPVYNKFKSRFLYKAQKQKSVDAHYAGDGYFLSSSIIITRAFWSDEKKVAISWAGSGQHAATIYIGGRWGQPVLPTGTILSTCFLVPDRSILSTGLTFTYVVGILVEAVATKTNTVYFYGAQKGSPVNIGSETVDDRINFSLLEGRASFQITSFATGLAITTIGNITNFTTDAKKIAHIPTADQIKVLTFSEDYSTVTISIIGTASLGSGISFAQKIREEAEDFSLIIVTHVELGLGNGRELWVCSMINGALVKVLRLRMSAGGISIGAAPLYFSARFAIALVYVSDFEGRETLKLHINGTVINLFGTPPPDGVDWTSLSFVFANYAELPDTLVICAPKNISAPLGGVTLIIDPVKKEYQYLDPALDLFIDTEFGELRAPVSLTHTKF